MCRYRLCIVIAWLVLSTLYAQKHDYNWVTGYEYDQPDPFGNMRIDFNYSPPEIFKENLKINFSICRGALSDSAGNLLLYTNGVRIFNKSNHVMSGGDSINFGPLWSQQQTYGYSTPYPVLALPLPQAEDVYYLFHSDLELEGIATQIYVRHLYFTIIDFKTNNGLGRVIAKNQVLMEGEIMWPAFVKHGNGRDWWIMGMQRANTRHYLYLLSPEGLSGPYIQDIGPPFVPTEYEGESLFSESGTMFLRHDSKTAIRLYDFDRCTGQLSNLRIIPYEEGALSSFYAAFSPNDRFLYLSRPGWVWSLDMQAADLSASYDSVATWEINVYPTYPWFTSYGLNQLGPDGKIYWSNWTSTQALNVMHHPDLPGDAADCEEEGVILPRWSDIGICQFPNYRLGEWDGSPCDTLNGQRPGDGFTHLLYEAPRYRRDTTGYVVLPPLRGPRCEDCTGRELELLNNPMAAIHALLHLQQSGKLPPEWPREKAERYGLFIALPPRPQATTEKEER